MRKLMILGAGVSQVPLILHAKKMGLYVVVVSRRGNYPGLALADRVYYEDTTDAERVLAVALKENIDGICTSGTDVAVKSVGLAASALGLVGVSNEAAALCSDKLLMKHALLSHGIKTAGYYSANDEHDIIEAFRKINAPVMIKAVDSGASKGIIRVDHEDEIGYAYQEVKKWTKRNQIIVEQFIEGEEFGAQAFILNGQLQFIMPHGDKVFYRDAGVPIGHYVPYEVPEIVAHRIKDTMLASVDALKLNNCAINADFILSDKEVYVLEIGARAGATCLPELVSTYYGHNYYEYMIRVSLGEKPVFNTEGARSCVCELLISDTSGIISRMENWNVSDPDVVDISFDYQPGDSISKFKVGTDRIGQIIAQGNSVVEAYRTIERVKANIRIETV